MQYFLKRNFNKLKKIVKKIIFERKRKSAMSIQNAYRAYSARTAYRRLIAYRNAQARAIQRIVRGTFSKNLEKNKKM